MLEFLKAPFLVLHFLHYTLLTFLMMLSVILLAMLMILLSILSMIRHLICDKNFNWLLNLNLIYEALSTQARRGLLISVLGKFNWFCLILEENHFLRSWGQLFVLNWIGALKLLKLPPQENWSFNSFYEVSMRLLCISINLPYAHEWNTVVTSGLVPLVVTWNC